MTTLGKAWYLESVLIGSNSYPGKRQKMRKKMDGMGKESEAAEQSDPYSNIYKILRVVIFLSWE